jgi:hypothetical protein
VAQLYRRRFREERLVRRTLRLLEEMRRIPVYRGVRCQKRMDLEDEFREKHGLTRRDITRLVGIGAALNEDHEFVPKGEKLKCPDCGLVLDVDRFELSRDPSDERGGSGPGSVPMTPGPPVNSGE